MHLHTRHPLTATTSPLPPWARTVLIVHGARRSALAFLKREYPWFQKHIGAFKSGVEKADILWYFILYHYGGVYADLDMECLRCPRTPCTLLTHFTSAPGAAARRASALRSALRRRQAMGAAAAEARPAPAVRPRG